MNRESIEDLVYRLRKRAEIRRSIQTRKSVQENQPDRIAELLDEAANVIAKLEGQLAFRIDAVTKYQALVKSPCIGKCNYDSTLGVCRDCHRTKQEISTWYVMTDDEKLNVLERLITK